MAFIDDIQGQDTQLYPIITIEPPETDIHDWTSLYQRVISISTHNVSLDHIRITHPDNADNPLFKNVHFKPLLLNIPSIKESIDVESRKFKVSNLSLDISNVDYEGKRFTEILEESNLLNWKVSLQYVSPSANLFSTIFHVGSWEGDYTNPSFYKKYEQIGESLGMTRMAYQGIVRKLSHDDEKVRIEVEDLTDNKSTMNLPKNALGGGNGVPPRYRNKPIPMVYGSVDRSPCVISDNYGKIIVDSDEVEASELFIGTSNGYVEVIKQFIGDDAPQDQYHYDNYNSFILSGSNIFPSVDNEHEPFLSVSDKTHSFSLKLLQEAGGGGGAGISTLMGQSDEFENMDFVETSEQSLQNITNGLNEENYIEMSASRHYEIESSPASGNIEVLLMRMVLIYTPSYEHKNLKFFNYSINGNVFPSNIAREEYFPVFSEDVQHHTENVYSNQIGGLSDDYWNNNDNSIAAGNVQPFAYWNSLLNFTYTGNASAITNTNPNADLDFDTSIEYENNYANNYDYKDADFLMVNLDESNESITFDFRTLWYVVPMNDNNPVDYTFNFSLKGNLNDITLSRTADLLKPLSKEYYANTTGRKNLDGNLITNPIEIIMNLVQRELNHITFDSESCQEAIDAHPANNWKFAFTINEKINSRELIQDIAKSTKSFPRFKNDGSFGFTTIKDNYTAIGDDSDYSKADLINESEVISYSFKKTKPEQIYNKVDVQYHKDYSEDSLSMRTNTIEDEHSSFYSTEESYLEFESEYIRDQNTANNLASFLSQQYKNDHLILSLKLPLKYMNLEIGGIVKFKELLGGLKAYGIDYRKIANPNHQYYYPLFMITSMSKNLDSISIECMQLHHLSGIAEGESDSTGWFADANEGDEFYFADSDVIVGTEAVLPYTPNPPFIDVNTGQVYNISSAPYVLSLPIAVATDFATPQGQDISGLVSIENLSTSEVYENIGQEIYLQDETTSFQFRYSVVSPTSGLESHQDFTFWVNWDGNMIPTISVNASGFGIYNESWNDGLLESFTHKVSIEGNEGIDYFEKYVLGDDQIITFSAYDNQDGDLTNDIQFGILDYDGQFLPFASPLDVFADAQAILSSSSSEYVPYNLTAIVYDSSGLYRYKTWQVEVYREYSETIEADGDVNLDGDLNIIDIVIMVNFIMGNTIPTQEQLAASDTSGDGGLNILDIVQAINLIMEDD